MRIVLKLYAGLAQHLPPQAEDNTTTLEVPDQATAHNVIDELKVPREKAHLILLNGVYLNPDERDTPRFHEGDTLAIWPPVAGG
ncbi:MAG: MoaD/ThiS family protein [Gammaproteobacteria bacterium]